MPLTSVLTPTRVPAEDALALYPYRWNIERMFFDLKEVLNLNRLYAANPNAVAMQVYAAGLVYKAMRVAQSEAATQVGLAPEDIAPAKCFPRLAAVAFRYLLEQEIERDLEQKWRQRHRRRHPQFRTVAVPTGVVGDPLGATGSADTVVVETEGALALEDSSEPVKPLYV